MTKEIKKIPYSDGFPWGNVENMQPIIYGKLIKYGLPISPIASIQLDSYTANYVYDESMETDENGNVVTKIETNHRWEFSISGTVDLVSGNAGELEMLSGKFFIVPLPISNKTVNAIFSSGASFSANKGESMKFSGSLIHYVQLNPIVSGGDVQTRSTAEE